MDLVFTPLEVAAVAAAVGISALIALDGESNWLEGALLMLVYAILAVSFFEFVCPPRSRVRRRRGGGRAAATGGAGVRPRGRGLGLGVAVGDRVVLVVIVVGRPGSNAVVGDRLGRRGASPSASAWAASESAACSAS